MGCGQISTYESIQKKEVLSKTINESAISKKKENKTNKNKSYSSKPKMKKSENIILSKNEALASSAIPAAQTEEIQNKSISKKEETKKGENSITKKNEEIEKKPLLKNEEIKEDENKGPSIFEEKKNDGNQLISNNKNNIEKSKPESSLSNANEPGNNCNFIFSKMDMFIDDEDNPLEKYDYFKIDFTICNYIFIIPEHLAQLFSSFY